MELKANALFTHDAAGRIVASNEPEGERAPRLFLGRTRNGNVWRFRDDLAAADVTELERLCRSEPPLREPRQRAAMYDAFCQVLSTRAPVDYVWEGPCWHFPTMLPAAEGVVVIGPEHREFLRAHYSWTADHLAAYWPCVAVVADDDVVSACFSARLTPAAAEAGVDTVEAFRGRGYAVRVAAAWANLVRQSGRVPIYSTSWDNAASQAVARKLGLLLFGAEISIG
jgi:RimJ/RimL family protein N-acetyltransferase